MRGKGPSPGDRRYPKRTVRPPPGVTAGGPRVGKRGPSSLSGGDPPAHNVGMERREFQLSVTGMLGLVAAIAVNVWLFKLSILLGIIGLNVTKHVAIAFLCQVLGVNRRTAPSTPAPPPAQVPGFPAP